MKRITVEGYTFRMEGEVILMYKGLFAYVDMPFAHSFVAPKTEEQKAVWSLIKDCWFPARMFIEGIR